MAASVPTIERVNASTVDVVRPILTKIVGNGKFQLTIPPQIRELYGLRDGDVMEWNFDPERGEIVLRPKRAQLITPRLLREARKMASEPVEEEEFLSPRVGKGRKSAKPSSR